MLTYTSILILKLLPSWDQDIGGVQCLPTIQIVSSLLSGFHCFETSVFEVERTGLVISLLLVTFDHHVRVLSTFYTLILVLNRKVMSRYSWWSDTHLSRSMTESDTE